VGLTPGLALSRNDLGQVVHIHVALSPSNIIWYRSRVGACGAMQLGSLALHWLCNAPQTSVADQPTGSRPKEGMCTPPTLLMGCGSLYHF